MDEEVAREFRNALTDISIDVAVQVVETGMDLLINAPELVEAIPIAGSLLRAVKGGLAIRDRLFAIKVANFLCQLHDGTIGRDEYETYRRRLDSDTEYLRSVSKVTVAQLESYNDDLKAVVLGELLKMHIKGDLTYDEYRFYAYCLAPMNPIGLKYLLALYSDHKIGTQPLIGALLVGTGLVAYSTGNHAGNDGAAFLTAEGKKLCDLALSKLSSRIGRV